MLVDPRPYTYEFRTPRYGNPTYRSNNLYESLYHRYPYKSNDYFSHQDREMYSSTQKLQKTDQHPKEYKHMERNYSEVKDRKTHQNNNFKTNQAPPPNPERRNESYKLPSISHTGQKARVEANLGNMSYAPQSKNVAQRKQGFERFGVYERQQKPYNIINCYPKENETNKLRNFPKYTLENKLIERGSYHDFKQEKM